jgi:hypothetical protein
MPEASKSDQPANYRRIALVAGYHPCSFPPAAAYAAGLKERFAVVLSSYRSEKREMFFDADLFALLTGALLQVVPHDSLDIELGVGLPALHSLRELTERQAGQDEMDLPLRMRVYCDGRIVALEETEFWSEVGGPDPYHDSFTLSFYTAENKVVEFRRNCEAVSSENGVTITAFHDALPHKGPFVPWWRRPIRWLGG